jgi:tetratricopeptide (TPR) repeat protein
LTRYGVTLTALLLAVGTCVGAVHPGADDNETAIRSFDAQIDAEHYAEVSSPLEVYVKAHPSSWRALYQLGYVDFRLHKLQASVTMLSRSLVLNGQFANAHRILAYDLNIMGRPDLAMPELRKAIQLDPTSAENHYELGRILFEQGSYAEAVEQFRKTQALAPEFVKAYHNLGLAYAALGQKTKAVAEFETALALNARASRPSAWPLIDFGTYYNMQEDFVHAKEMLQRAIALDNRWDQAYSELAKAYRGLGQTALAIESYDRAIAINPNKLEYHYALAALYRRAGRPAAAIQELKTYARLKDAGGPK